VPSPSTEQPAHGHFHIHGRPETDAALTVLRHDRAARMRRSLQALGACWGCAIIAVFLPVLHFVLVPLLLLAGPLMSLQKFREHVTLVRAEGACPACAAPQAHRLNSEARERTVLRCEACGRALELRPDPDVLARG